MSCWLSDGKGKVYPVNSSGQLEQQLVEANASQSTNQIWALERDAGDVMYIGLAGDRAFINYLPNPDAGGGVVTLDQTIPEDKGTLWFDFAGSGSEISLRNCLPARLVFKAVVEFYETGELPKWVHWQQV
jgi:hypothetical protein